MSADGDEARPERHAVVVGIPTLNGHSRLDRCLKSIAAYTPLARLRASVLVCDDGSRPEELEANKAVAARHGVPMLMNMARLGVAESWNRLSRHAILNWGTSVVALINDDVEVVPDWLDALVFSVRMNPHAGMVGLNAWSGRNSESFSPPPEPDWREATMRRFHGMLSSCGWCFAFSAEKFDAVGGFDPEYFCFYEEVDFGVQLLRRGWPSYMLDYPIVFHQGGATTTVSGNIDAAAHLVESRERFKSKWGSVERQRLLDRPCRWPECASWNTVLRTLVD